jgi:hypothetical protein
MAQTYSDVKGVEESGDVVGTELTLQVAGKRVTGTLRHYEGTEPEPIAVAGRLEGDALTLRGSYSEGKVEITARLQNDRITGKLSYRLTGQTNDVELNLPRVVHPRMQKAALEETAPPTSSEWVPKVRSCPVSSRDTLRLRALHRNRPPPRPAVNSRSAVARRLGGGESPLW